MIVNIVPNPIEHMIHRMAASDIQFYMTGSRYSQMNTTESDYDYFTEYSVATKEWLQENGFFPIERDFTSYNDPSIVQVWRYVSIQQIDMQLIRSNYMLAKCEANELLLKGVGSQYYHALIDKRSQSLMWGMTISEIQERIIRAKKGT